MKFPELKHCARCLYPSNHPYGMIFDEHGVCMGCRIHEEKDFLDWDARFEKLKTLVRENTSGVKGNNFDCIVPVTGGGDSFFVVHVVKNLLGLNPLLVNYNSHFNTRVGIRNLANLQTVFDCEMIQSTLSPSLIKHVTRETLSQLGSMYWQVLAGNSVYPVQMAVKFRTPLIIWGVHGWSEQVGMFSHLDEVEMTARCREEHCLMGRSATSLLGQMSSLSYRDIEPWTYPSDYELEQVGVRGIYLSNYIRWDAKSQHELMMDLYGFEPAEQQRTFNTYEDQHCVHSAGLHDYLKYLKYGYGKVTDHVSREIRLKRMDRSTGIDLINEYVERYPTDLNVFLNWLEMDESAFWLQADKYRDPRVWKKVNGEYIREETFASTSKEMLEKARLESSDDWCYRNEGSKEPNENTKSYLLMGRGYVDEFNYGAVDPCPVDGKYSQGLWSEPALGLSNKYEIL